MNQTRKSSLQRWILLPYFVTCFYYFGVTMMTYFVSYPQLQKITKNIYNYMQLFNEKMMLFYYVPAAFMFLSLLLLNYYCIKVFRRPILWWSLGLGTISVASTFILVLPLQRALPTAGFTPQLSNSLLMYGKYFQLAPAALQTAIAVRLLQIYLKKTTKSQIAIWLFIAVFSLSMYSWGTLYMESLVGYPMWLLVDPTEWLPTRESVGLNIPAFIWVFLIPVYLPLILLLSMFWFRPNGVRRSSVVLMFVMLLWVFIITAVYFVPDIQLKLAEGYNAKLIKLLNKTDFPLRGIPDLVYFFTACYMFLSIDKIKADSQ